MLQACVEAELKEPLMPVLQAQIAGRPCIAAASTARQLEKLLKQCGGPAEKQRWQHLRQQLEVVDPASIKSRVNDLQGLTPAQKDMFGLGDGRHALTLTANARALESCLRQGVHLEAFVHHAVWLTGK